MRPTKLLLSFCIQDDDDLNESKDNFLSGVAVGPNGRYIVVDHALGYAKIYKSDGTYKKKLGQNKLKTPWDAFVTRTGKIVISDTTNATLMIFDRHGRYASETNCATYIQEPSGIAYCTRTGHSIVTDTGSSCAWGHDGNGHVSEVVKVTDAHEDTVGILPLQKPNYVAYDNNQNILLTDRGTNCLYAFTPDGALLWTYANPDSNEESSIQGLAGICVDKDGLIFVADSVNCRIHVLDAVGNFIHYLLTWEDGLADPQCLAIDLAGHLVVGEANTGLVKVYQYDMSGNHDMDSLDSEIEDF